MHRSLCTRTWACLEITGDAEDLFHGGHPSQCLAHAMEMHGLHALLHSLRSEPACFDLLQNELTDGVRHHEHLEDCTATPESRAVALRVADRAVQNDRTLFRHLVELHALDHLRKRLEGLFAVPAERAH